MTIYIDAFEKELFKGIYFSVIFQVMHVFKLSSKSVSSCIYLVDLDGFG